VSAFPSRRRVGTTIVPPLIAWAALLIGLAYFLYQPTRPRPFDILDFSEFLPLLTAHRSMLDQFLALCRYYLQGQGRTNVLPYAAIALKWGVFGPDVVAWQLLRFFQMLGLVAALYHLCRRLGASPAGAGWGSALLVSAGSASDAWIRLTVGEPLGLMFYLGALELSLRYQEVASWRRRATGIVVLLTSMVLCKETLTALIPFLFLIAFFRQTDGSYKWPGWTPRNIGLLAVVMAAMVLLGVIMLAVRSSAAHEAFALQYGSTSPSGHVLLVTTLVFLLPSHPTLEPRSVVLPADLLFLTVVEWGWWLRFRRSDDRRGRWLLLVGLLSVPVAGAIAYEPWPMRELFYGLPFFIAPAVLLAIAVTSVEEHGAKAGLTAQMLCGGIVALTATQAYCLAGFRTARQEVNYALAAQLSHLDVHDSGFVALNSTFVESWRGPGPALMRYGRVTARRSTMPTLVNIPCEDLGRMLGSPPARTVRALVSYSNSCGPLPGAVRISRWYRYYDPIRLSSDPGGFYADIVLQQAAAPTAPTRPAGPEEGATDAGEAPHLGQ